MKKKKILVIGASGMLAGPVIRKLDAADFELRLFSRSVKPSMFINEYEIVRGDLFNPDDLRKAVQGCDAIHISLSSADEAGATARIVQAAKEHGIRQISMVSGCTVAEENRWFSFVDQKFRAEQLVMLSGIPWFIFRATWFFESLELMVRNGKATVLGKQEGIFHWVAADDLGSMVARAYEGKEENRIHYVYGPEGYRMKDLLEKYCRELHPDITKVSEVPIPVLKTIAFLTGKKQLREAARLFSYFEKVREPEIPEEELNRPGKPATDFQTWIKTRRSE